MLSDADLDAIRAYAERNGVKPWTEHIFKLLDELDRLRAKETESEWEYGVQHLEAPGFSFDSGFFPECAEHGCYRVRRHPFRRTP